LTIPSYKKAKGNLIIVVITSVIMADIVTAQRTGGGISVPIPAGICRMRSISPGTSFEVDVQGDMIIFKKSLIPAPRKRKGKFANRKKKSGSAHKGAR
jgi:antitoxin component of MazEF toxin-antitoxin module